MPTASVEDHHRCSPDQAVHREREQVSRDAGLAVGRDQFIGVLVRDDRGDAGDSHHGERSRDPDEPIGRRNSSSRQPFTNGSSSPKPPASRSASVRAVMA